MPPIEEPEAKLWRTMEELAFEPGEFSKEAALWAELNDDVSRRIFETHGRFARPSRRIWRLHKDAQ